MARTAAWCQRVLGLEPLSPAGESSRLGSATGGPLVELRERPGLRPVPPRGLLGLYHYALLLPSRADLGRFLVHLRELGEPFGASDHLFSEAIYLTDPDGITVEVYADRPREQWVYRDGEIVGALDPLDDADLVRAAGSSRWQGVPADTRMGHLHFFTADLATANRFYVEALGFAVSIRSLPGALFVAAGGYHHHVGLNVWAASERQADEGDAGLDTWSLVVPSAAARAALTDRLSASHVAVETGSGPRVASDPWGIRVRIMGS